MKIKILTGGRGSGKTTRALESLHMKGGGIFVVPDEYGMEHARGLCKQHGFRNIVFLITERIVVDDTDLIDTVVVRPSRKGEFL